MGAGGEDANAHPDARTRFPRIALRRQHLHQSHRPGPPATAVTATSLCLPQGCSPGPTGSGRGANPKRPSLQRRISSSVALPPAPKSGKAPLSSARSDVAMPMPMPYLGPSWALGSRWASTALQGTREHYFVTVLAGGTGQGGGSGAAWSQHCHPTPAPWGDARPG